MKKTIISLLLLCCISYSTSIANPVLPSGNGGIQLIVLTCRTVDLSVVIDGHHRIPPRIPNVYLDQEGATLYFETSCYDCTLELVIPGTDTSIYSAVIPDGTTELQLPESISGEYELHIHCGNYCFYGIINI